MNLFVVVYIDRCRYRCISKKKIAECNDMGDLKIFIEDEDAKHVCFIIPKHISFDETQEFIEEVLQHNGGISFILRRPSTLCRNTFGLPSLMYLNINITDKDDVTMHEAENNSGNSTILIDELKKMKIADHCEIELYYELSLNTTENFGEFGMFKGQLEDVIAEFISYVGLANQTSELIDNIYIDSRNLLLMRKFRDSLTMKICMNECSSRNISKVAFLSTPRFLKNIGFIWNNVKSDAVICGLLKEIRNLDGDKIFMEPQKINDLAITDIH